MAILLLASAVIAFLTRNLPKNYREARWIALTTYNGLFAFVFILVSLLVHDIYVNFTLLAVAILWLNAGVLIFMFGIKILIVIKPDLLSDSDGRSSTRSTTKVSSTIAKTADAM
jgi:hypothetical protein